MKTHRKRAALAVMVLLGAGVFTAKIAKAGPPLEALGSLSSFMPEGAAPALDPSIYHHVAQLTWVVADLDRVVDYWQNLGIHDIHRDGEVKFPNLLYRGKPDPATVKQVTAKVGELEIRWIQPMRGGRFWRDGLQEHRDGIRVLSYAARSTQEFDDQIKYFSAKG